MIKKTYLLTALAAVMLAGCDPSSEVVDLNPENDPVEEEAILANMDAYYAFRVVNTQAAKQDKDISLDSRAFFALVSTNQDPDFSFAGRHRKAQAYLEKAAGSPIEWRVKQTVGLTMLSSVFPRIDEEVPETIKLDYVALLNEGMSQEFLVIVETLESVSGHRERVVTLARHALTNLHALKRIHTEDVAEQQRWLLNDALTETQSENLRVAIESLERQWPPTVQHPDGRFTTSKLDVHDIQSRLAQLLSQ